MYIYSNHYLSGFPKRATKKGYKYPYTPQVARRLIERYDWHAPEDLAEIIAHQDEAMTFQERGFKSWDFIGLPSDLWQHQAKAIIFGRLIWRGLIWAPMGSGKTRIGAELAKGKKALVLCPKYVIPIWQKEAPYATVYNYERFWRPSIWKDLTKQKFDIIIADEIQKLKSHNSKQSKYAAMIEAPRRIGLSGTPYPNSILDYFGIWRFLDPGIFGINWTDFLDRYTVRVKEHIIVKYKNVDELVEKTAPYTFVIYEPNLDLPPITKTIIPVSLPRRVMKAYKSMEKDFIIKLKNDAITAGNALVKALRLQMLTSGIEYTDSGRRIIMHTQKERALEELLDASRNQRVVVFGRFKYDMKVAETAALYTGRAFSRIPPFPDHIEDVAALQIRSGIGVDLTEATVAIFLSTGYSLADVEQAIARLYRPPQSKPVRVYFIVAKGTIDEKIMKCLKEKRDLVQYLKRS